MYYNNFLFFWGPVHPVQLKKKITHPYHRSIMESESFAGRPNFSRREGDFYGFDDSGDYHGRQPRQQSSSQRPVPMQPHVPNTLVLPPQPPKPVTRWLDISSAFRNRRLTNQSICDFSIPVNAPSRNDPTSALDPVALAFPFCTNFTSAASTTTSIRLNTSSTSVPNYFAGCYLEIGGVFALITLYRADTQVAEVDTPFAAAPPTGTLYTIRAQRPLYRGTVAAPVVGGNMSVTLDAGASSSSSTYHHCFVFLPGTVPPTSYRWAPIVAYDPLTRTATLGGGGIGNMAPEAGEPVEILAFTRDNVVPLVYTAQEPLQSAASSAGPAGGAGGGGGGGGAGGPSGAKPPMYRLKLSDLIMPNLPVANGYHGRLSDYSHIYVAINNDQGASFSNIFLSNNPYSNQALWKVPMSQFSNSMPFLYFDGGDIEQVVRFRPDQNMRVTIWLPNGQILAFQDQSPTFFFPGLYFPIDNNPFAQVTFTIGITRIN